MSSYKEVIETRGDFRAVITPNDMGLEPESYGETVLLCIERREASIARAGDTDDLAVAAFNRWCSRPGDDGWKFFTKYVRAYLGATTVQHWYSENGNYYVAYDTPAWRAERWFTEEKAGADWREQVAACDLVSEDWKSYTNGDVWDVTVEKRVTWKTDDDDYGDRDTWEPVPDGERCLVYGRERVEYVADDLLNEFAPEPASA
jgi:hypothetical protein